MLVLSRRVNEELVFPKLDIRIKILRSVGARVRLGIDAPEFIEILRSECVEPSTTDPSAEGPSNHEVRNYVNAIRLGVELYERQMQRGEIEGANRTFLSLVARSRGVSDTTSVIPSEVEAATCGPKVLVVDDDANERQLLAGLLQMAGCRVQTVSDGLAAIEHLQKSDIPEIVLLDMQMPRLSGRDTLGAIRDRWTDLLVFGVSGSTPSDNGITLGGPRGVDEWFNKPLNPRQLVNRVRERLGTALNA